MRNWSSGTHRGCGISCGNSRRRSAAEDLLQEVWLDVFRGLPRLADPQAFRAWIYRIARDRAFGHLRKSKRQEQPLGEIDVPDEAAEEGEFSPEDAARIHAALGDLPLEQREVLVLRFLEEMSYDEIARVTSQPLGTVRSRIHYAKRALSMRWKSRVGQGRRGRSPPKRRNLWWACELRSLGPTLQQDQTDG